VLGLRECGDGDVRLEDGEREDGKAARVAIHEGHGEGPGAGDGEVETEGEGAAERREGRDDAGGGGREVGEVAGEGGLGGHCGRWVRLMANGKKAAGILELELMSQKR